MTEPDSPDYVTVQHVPSTPLYVIRRMTWDARADSYQVDWESAPMSGTEARLRARKMAQDTALDYRP